MKSFGEYLEEAFVSPNNGSKYGQVIFLMGGAGSGKSTALRRFLDVGNYKILNPDDLKELMVRAGKKGAESFKDVADLDPNTPEDSAKLHTIYRDKRVGRAHSNILKQTGRTILPNIILDRTFAFPGEMRTISQRLYAAGYKPENVHIVFIDTDPDEASRRNKLRTRSLPDPVIRSTNVGSRKNFRDFLYKRLRQVTVNGEIWVVHNDTIKRIKKAGKKFKR